MVKKILIAISQKSNKILKELAKKEKRPKNITLDILINKLTEKK